MAENTFWGIFFSQYPAESLVLSLVQQTLTPEACEEKVDE